MGIDALEIRFRLEKRFGIRFEGEGALVPFHNTADTLCDFVWAKVNGIEPGAPDVQKLYARVNKALQTAGRGWWRSWYGNPRIMDLLGSDDVDEKWNKFQRALGLSLPALARSAGSDDAVVPAECATISRLVQWIIEQHPQRIDWQRPPGTRTRQRPVACISREECWSGVREILAETLGVDPEQVVPDAHLIDELGMC